MMIYRLLIVDDEPDIVDGLFRVFRNIDHIELDIYKAYSGFEALDILNTARIDIVLTDIHMPGLSGLQLVEKVYKNWPYCKVIFLTGYDTFEYIYEAIRYEGASYLLKTEGFDEIIHAVEKAILQIQDNIKFQHLKQQAEESTQKVIPFMQKDYLLSLINGIKSTSNTREQQFAELNIPLDWNAPILLSIGRIGGTYKELSYLEKSKVLFTIEQIGAQCLPSLLNTVYLFCEHSILLMINQPKLNENGGSYEVHNWDKISLMLKSSVEAIQSHCMNVLDLPISFLIDGQPIDWDELPNRYDALKLIIRSRVGPGMEMALIKEDQSMEDNIPQYSQQFRQLKNLEACLESGQKEEFHSILDEMLRDLIALHCSEKKLTIKLFYEISMMFFTYIHHYSLTEKLGFRIDLNKLMYVDLYNSWYEVKVYFSLLGDEIFKFQASEDADRPQANISNVKRYIHDHLNEDLSLVKLANMVYYNPSYLSRLFKQITGETLLGYINTARLEKAKELLRDGGLKINEIALGLGYESPAYFTQFFKRLTKQSPQDYRQSIHDK